MQKKYPAPVQKYKKLPNKMIQQAEPGIWVKQIIRVYNLYPIADLITQWLWVRLNYGISSEYMMANNYLS